jgi:hypothetical protein
MFKTIFVTVLAATSIASACKISKAGLSANLIINVTQEAFQTMDSSSEIKAVYKENDNNNYIVETLNENNECTAQLFNAQFDTLACKVNVNYIATFLPIPCK